MLTPRFVDKLLADQIQTVFIAGCGGGFDFLHGMLLYEALRERGKRVLVGSYSFGEPERIEGAPVVFQEGGAVVKRVCAESVADPHYGPEVHLCSFLDGRLPDAAPHEIYAYYARAWTVPALRTFYQGLVDEHAIDAFVLVDGGSDSLMRGDEEGLGDPVEDAVSVATVASLSGLKERLLLSVGLGCDRFAHVSDAATFRAIAELTAAQGFCGAVAFDNRSRGLSFYRDAIEHIYARQEFRSVLTGCVLSAAEGSFGCREVPPRLRSRVRPGEAFIWPLMAMVWAFEVEVVAQRSLLCPALEELDSVPLCHARVEQLRADLGDALRPVENIPPHERLRATWGR